MLDALYQLHLISNVWLIHLAALYTMGHLWKHHASAAAPRTFCIALAKHFLGT